MTMIIKLNIALDGLSQNKDSIAITDTERRNKSPPEYHYISLLERIS